MSLSCRPLGRILGAARRIPDKLPELQTPKTNAQQEDEQLPRQSQLVHLQSTPLEEPELSQNCSTASDGSEPVHHVVLGSRRDLQPRGLLDLVLDVLASQLVHMVCEAIQVVDQVRVHGEELLQIRIRLSNSTS